MQMQAQPGSIPQSDIETLFRQQQAFCRQVAAARAAERIRKLRKLYKAVLSHREELQKAMYLDFRKPAAEVDLTEIFMVTSEIKFAIRHLHQWMRPRPVPTPITLWGTSSEVRYEPKGVVLIISPWNFPINLTLGPLVGAIAAGNCAIIKPSELTSRTSAALGRLIASVFDPREIALLEGGKETASALLDLPFDHIFFTGSTSLGKLVMQKAARHLSSVTLELGGKSPAIVDESADIAQAAQSIAWGKWINNGQICISPDHVWVHRSRKKELVEALKKQIRLFYGDPGGIDQAADYARIVNERHYDRLTEYLQDAFDKGATLLAGGETDAAQRLIGPTILENVPGDALLMQEEIFGPILPISEYDDLEKLSVHIRSGAKPLALYMYSNSKRNTRLILDGTSSGTAALNTNLIQFFNPHLGFGGVNASGIGKAHGFHSFEVFSNAKAVLKQWSPWISLRLFMPPYTPLKSRLLRQVIRWF